MVVVVITRYLVVMWAGYIKDIETAVKKEVKTPSWVGPGVTTIFTIGVFALATTLGWNAMVNLTTSTTVKYVNPAAAQEQKNVSESQLPTSQELDQVRTEQKERQQVNPHKEALDSFDESMKLEAEKIRQRSLDKPAASSSK
jgi:hypothetical protein